MLDLLLQKVELLSSVSEQEEVVSLPSPSRTAESLSSGDLADVSSMSKTSSNHSTPSKSGSLEHLPRHSTSTSSSSGKSYSQRKVISLPKGFEPQATSSQGKPPAQPADPGHSASGGGHQHTASLAISTIGTLPAQSHTEAAPHSTVSSTSIKLKGSNSESLKSESLFSTPSVPGDDPSRGVDSKSASKSSTSSSSSSLKQSASLFSSSEDHAMVPEDKSTDNETRHGATVDVDDALFSKPDIPPPRQRTRSGRRSGPESTCTSSISSHGGDDSLGIIPPTDPSEHTKKQKQLGTVASVPPAGQVESMHQVEVLVDDAGSNQLKQTTKKTKGKGKGKAKVRSEG